MKKHHWHVFRHEKLFEKQPLPHCQTHSKSIFYKITFFKPQPQQLPQYQIHPGKLKIN